jgi:uncharacterized protein (DUF779 family)
LCVREGELLVGPPTDVLLGEVVGVQCWIDADQYRRWRRPQLQLDVASGAPSGLSLEGVHGVHFVVHTKHGSPAGSDCPL